MKKIILLSISLLVCASVSFGQKNFVPLQEKDSVLVEYRWKSYKNEDKQEAYKLVIRMENTNPFPVKITLEVGYYWKTIQKASGDELVYCLKPRKAIIGDMKRSRFDSSDFTFDELTSDNFLLELNKFEVKKVENCK